MTGEYSEIIGKSFFTLFLPPSSPKLQVNDSALKDIPWELSLKCVTFLEPWISLGPAVRMAQTPGVSKTQSTSPMGYAFFICPK